MRMWTISARLLAFLLIAACATLPRLPPTPQHANGQILWGIVHGSCVPHQIAEKAPAPCAEVAIGGGEAGGYAVLKDRVGVAQHLVMPTRLIPGIEEPALLAPGATDYFAAAWRARTYVDAKLGAPLPRADASVAVNSIYGRSQDLLHLHVDCLRTDVRDALRAALPRIGRDWTRGTVTLGGHAYRAVRLAGADAPAENAFVRLSRGLHVPKGEMGGWTLVLAGADFADGPGFVLLAGRVDLKAGDNASGEVLQDHDCAGRVRT